MGADCCGVSNNHAYQMSTPPKETHDETKPYVQSKSFDTPGPKEP